MSDLVSVRLATVADAGIIAWHRARMFQDMGDVSPEMFEALREKAEPALEAKLRSGNYLGWLATDPQDPGKIVAGAGVFLGEILPRPFRREKITEGRQATIVNVFTEPAWRKRGIAALLLQEIIKWCRAQGIERITLHASKEGRSLYQRLGFTDSNEMRLVRDGQGTT